jgi:hypothetical protein
MKLKYTIGDFVSVKARQVRDFEKGPKVGWKRVAFEKPVRGWVVGAVRRFTGTIKAEDEGDSCYRANYLSVDGSRIFYKVARSMTNVPLECAEEDLGLSVSIVSFKMSVPFKLGCPMTAIDRSILREDMKDVPRDAKGRWKSVKETP